MAWIETATTAVRAASLINQFAQSSNLIRRYASRIIYWFQHGVAVIPIFGAGGSGKTTVAKIVASGEPLELSTPYDESWLIESESLQGDIPGRLLVAPGQGARVDRHWPDLFAKVQDGTAFGVINVVSYGYHAMGLRSYKEHDFYREGMNEAEFMAAYLPERRKIEIDLLKKLLASMTQVKRPFWALTLVTKQDLWWNEAPAVRKHYEKGEYADLIQKFREQNGSHEFQHEFLPVSLVLGNMTTPTSETLAQTTTGYDMPIHLAHLQTLFTKLHALIAQGSMSPPTASPPPSGVT